MNELQRFESFKTASGTWPTKRELKEQACIMVNTCPDYLTSCLLDEEDAGENGQLKKRLHALIRSIMLFVGIMTLGVIGLMFDHSAKFFVFVGAMSMIALLFISVMCRVVLKKYAHRVLRSLWGMG